MDISLQFQLVAKALGVTYTLKGDTLPVEKLFTNESLLPAIMRRADQLASFCLGHGLGVTFERQEGTTLGVRVDFDDKVSDVLRLMCATDALIEIVQGAPSAEIVPLDDLLLD